MGYGVVRDRQRRGYASEATRGLVARAFAHTGVNRIIAETYPELAPSIGVLHKCGFHLISEGSEPDVIRFEITREEYTTSSGGVGCLYINGLAGIDLKVLEQLVQRSVRALRARN